MVFLHDDHHYQHDDDDTDNNGQQRRPPPKARAREFYPLYQETKQALNLKDGVSTERPIYWRLEDVIGEEEIEKNENTTTL
jgi:hypothetical protein